MKFAVLPFAALFAVAAPAAFEVVYDDRTPQSEREWADKDYIREQLEVIADLEPGTEYVYWVESRGEKSPQHGFRTAGTSGSYNFLWMSDVHSHSSEPDKMVTVEKLRQDAAERRVGVREGVAPRHGHAHGRPERLVRGCDVADRVERLGLRHLPEKQP